MKRKWAFQQTIVFLGLFLSASALLAAETKFELSATASYFPVPHHQMFIYLARDEGLFDKYGLKLNYQPMKSAADMYKAIAAGQFDVGTSFISQHLDAVAMGIPVKAVGSHLPVHYYHFWAKADSSIRSMKDLNGKTVAISGLGGIEHFYVKMAEQKFKVKLNVVTVGGGTAQFTLVIAGEAAACVRANSVAQEFLNKKLIKAIEGSATVDLLPSPWAEGILWASNDVIKKKPEGVRRFLKATSEALKIMSNKDSYIKADMKYFKVDQKTATQRQKDYDWSPQLAIHPEVLKKAVDYFQDFGIIDRKVTVEQAYDPSFLPK